MAIDTPQESALRRKHYALTEKQQNYEPVSAGRFEAPATMSMLGIRERPVEYVPNEKAKEFLRDFFIQTGLPLTVKPGQGEERSYGTGFGYYRPLEAGGSIDPRGRTVYIDPKNPDFHTLIHEAGHAQDPNLYNRAIEEGLDRDKFYGTLVEDESVGDNLRRFISMTGPRSRLEAETVAQKYVIDYLKGNLKESFNFYQNQSGLKSAINTAEKYLNNKGINCNQENIQVIDGTMMGIYISMKWASRINGDILSLGPIYDPIWRHAEDNGNKVRWLGLKRMVLMKKSC